MTVSIRDATPSDAPAISHYNNRLAQETESRSLEMDIIGPGVEALLADQTKGRYWVAEKDGKVIGQIGVSYEWSDWRNGMLWWIQSVYVHSEQRRKGVYTALFRHVESLARADNEVIGIRLYVDQDNERARSTYEKLGMNMTTYRVMQTLFGRSE